MRPSFGRSIAAAAAGVALTAVNGAQVLAASEGKLAEPIQFSLAPGIGTYLSVISDDGSTYSRFKPGASLNLGGDVKIKMKRGRIRTWSIYWGQCDDDDCFKFSGNHLLFGKYGNDAKLIQTVVNFPLETDLIPGADGNISANPTAANIIGKCNQARSGGAPPNTSIHLTYAVPITLGADTFLKTDLTPVQASVGSMVASSDIDFAKTIMVALPIKCEPLQSGPVASNDEATVLPDLKLVAAELALQHGQGLPQHALTYSGSCPLGVTLHVGATTNIKGAVSGYVQHKGAAGGVDWQSSEFTMTTAATAGAHWKKVWTDLKQLPFQQAGVPSNPGGGGVVNNQPGGGIQFNPNGGNSGLNPATSVAAGNHQIPAGRHIGYFRYTAYTGKTVLPIGPGGSDVTSYENFKQTPWRKYDITCKPKHSGVAVNIPGSLANPTSSKTGQINTGFNARQVSSRVPTRVATHSSQPKKEAKRVSQQRVAVCKNGWRRGRLCVCRKGWTRRKISRFEVVCNRPARRIVKQVRNFRKKDLRKVRSVVRNELRRNRTNARRTTSSRRKKLVRRSTATTSSRRQRIRQRIVNRIRQYRRR